MRVAPDRFIQALMSPADGLVELRALPSRRQGFFGVDAPTTISKFIDGHRDENLYVGIAARRDSSSGRLENCTKLRALYVDIDFKMFSGGETDARVMLDTFPLTPSIVIATGGGLHAYWVLAEPLDLTTSDDARSARALLRAIAAAVGGDLASAEAARVLRVPGTLNFKYDPPRVVGAEHFAPECRYTPADLLAVLPPIPGPNPGTFTMPDAESVARGNRNDTLYRLSRSLMAKRLIPRAIMAAALATNQSFAEPLSEEEVIRIVKNALSQPDRSGFRARAYDEDGLVPDPEHDPLAASAPNDPEAVTFTEEALSAKLALLPYEVLDAAEKRDLFIATEFVRLWGADIRLAPQEPWPRWWMGTHWAEDAARGRRWHLAVLSLRLLAHAPKVVRIPDTVITENVKRLRATYEKKKREEDPALVIPDDAALKVEAETLCRKGLAAGMRPVIRKYSEHRNLTAMLTLASQQPPIRVHVNDFNRDPWLLGCQNGTLDLRTGELRESDPNDLITKIVPVAFDPQAACPTWERFLDHIFKRDQDVIAFMQRSLGYCLTGDTSEQVVWLLWGSGANGKTTLLLVPYALLGSYAAHTRAETFMIKHHSDVIPADVAALHGARFVYAVEPNKGARLDESLIKALTGGDPITARFMRRDFFTFTPQFKVFLGMNSKPRIIGSDHGIWRRPLLVPFDVTIPPEEQDKTLLSKLTLELPGILTWCLKGELERQRIGLCPPRSVVAATEQYREEQDRLAEWLTTGLYARGNDNDFVSIALLHEDYVRWCMESSEKHPMSIGALGSALEERGCPRHRSTKGMRGHRRIRLKDPECDPADGGWSRQAG
jgi:P4 family phage/plasmid primase-like protien